MPSRDSVFLKMREIIQIQCGDMANLVGNEYWRAVNRSVLWASSETLWDKDVNFEQCGLDAEFSPRVLACVAQDTALSLTPQSSDPLESTITW